MKSMVDLSHDFLKEALHPQAVCIDATLGQGKDSLFFMQNKARRIYGFETAKEAFDKTRDWLEKKKEKGNYRTEIHLFNTTHARMKEKSGLEEGSVDAIVFNFGYYPPDPDLSQTCPHDSSQAVRQAITLLRRKGRMALVFYDHEKAREEQEAVLDVLKEYRQELDVQEIRQLFQQDAPFLILVSHK